MKTIKKIIGTIIATICLYVVELILFALTKVASIPLWSYIAVVMTFVLYFIILFVIWFEK